jgi:hypothetical protein
MIIWQNRCDERTIIADGTRLMISDLGVGIWDLVAETRPVGRVSLDFGFWIVDFGFCFRSVVLSVFWGSRGGNPTGREGESSFWILDFGFWILFPFRGSFCVLGISWRKPDR